MTMEEVRQRQARSVYEKLVEAMLTPIKNLKKPWGKLDEVEQDQFLAQLDDILREAVRDAVDLVAADDMPHIKVMLEKVSFADAVQGTISMANTDALRHKLADAAKKTVILVVPDYEAHLQGERPKSEPLQKDLGLEKAVNDAMSQAEKDEEQRREQQRIDAMIARDEHGCWVALVNVGADWITEADIATWTLEQISEARAWAVACADLDDETPPPPMPEFLKRQD